MNEHPKVFISYSWDNDYHKKWVRSFAERLRKDGIDVMLDQWDAVPGDQLTAFMDKAIRENNFVLIVCTPAYKTKADISHGGVGYEGYVIQGEVFTMNNHRKFIPLLRKGEWTQAAPSALLGKYYIDLRDGSNYEINYQDLLLTLRGKRPVAPPIGEYQSDSAGKEFTPATHTKQIKKDSVSKKIALPRINYKIFLFVSFAALVVIILIAVSIKDCPTDFQSQVFRIILAIGIAGLAAALPGFITIRYKEFVSAGGALAVFFIVFLLEPAKLANAKNCIGSFSVTAHLEKRNGDFSPFVNQKVRLYIGNHVLDPKEVNNNGEVIFDKISSEYMEDTIRLKPVNPKMRVVSQNVLVPSQTSSATEVTFFIEIDPDTTMVRGKVYVPKGTTSIPVSGAILVFNNEFKAETTPTGNYTIALPIKEGEECEVQIIYKDVVVFDDRTLISSKIALDFPVKALK